MRESTRILRSRILDNLSLDIYERAKANPTKLTPHEIRMVRHLNMFTAQTPLDEKIIIANKLGKKVMVVVIDDEKGIDHNEFMKLFRRTWLTPEQNNEAIELTEDKCLSVVSTETVARWLQKYELFIGSDMVDVARAMKRIKNKKVGIQKHHFNNEEIELKTLFFSTILRQHFAIQNTETYLTMMAIDEKQLSILSVLYLSSRPMESELVRMKMEKLLRQPVKQLRQHIIKLSKLGYIHRVEKESSHVNHRTPLWMLTFKGHELIEEFIKKVTEETIGTIYD
jgi:DNA-binding MarR family transcriptional regulator